MYACAVKKINMEGFICPNCKLKFDSSENLISHFQECGDEIHEKVELGGKGKFLKDRFSQIVKTEQVEKSIELQLIGYRNSYTENVIKLRQKQGHQSILSENKAIIKLSKLKELKKAYSESNLKNLQKELVSWVPDSKCCHLCNSSFGLFTRRHHCRVCGNNICDGCTVKIEYDYYLINYRMEITVNGSAELSNSNDNQSLLLICQNCKNIFEKRSKARVFAKQENTSIIILYKNWINAVILSFKMAKNNLKKGTSELKSSILNIDSYCKRILEKAQKETEDSKNGAILKLAKSIKLASHNYLIKIHELLDSS